LLICFGPFHRIPNVRLILESGVFGIDDLVFRIVTFAILNSLDMCPLVSQVGSQDIGGSVLETFVHGDLVGLVVELGDCIWLMVQNVLLYRARK
jgi:hypothetical protein